MKLQLLKEPRELKPWVDIDATITKFGYNPCWFKSSSERMVTSKCTQCRTLRDAKLRAAELHPLCLRCSNGKNAKINTEIRVQKTKAIWARIGHPRLGKKHTVATRAKIKQNRKPAIYSDEYRLNASQRNTGMGNPFYGKHHKPESIRRGKESPAYGKVPGHSFKVWYPKKDGLQVCFRSIWEARVAAFLDQCNIDWQYESQVFPVQYEWNGKIKQSTYRADFYLPKTDSFIEVKGLWRPEYLAKYEALRRQYDIGVEVWDRAALKKRGIRTGKCTKRETCVYVRVK